MNSIARTTRLRQRVGAALLGVLALALVLPHSARSVELASVAAAQDKAQANWSDTIQQVVNSVVSLEIAHQRHFADEKQGLSSATGFVVDAEKGYILTNRHVLGLGPILGYARFQNQQKVPVKGIYRDPLHDFSILQFDPASLRGFRPKALTLAPEKAKRGLDIRVLGSDGGEQLSILAGTIARLDRAAPHYGRYGYNDFNTFYFQAASGTSGGSSGSPVVDLAGDVVALNAAANSNAASSYFLPLNAAVRALALLREGQAVSRGTLQTVFEYTPAGELARLGLPERAIERLQPADQRYPGLLTVRQVFPSGAAEGRLQVGDILLSLNEQPVQDFYQLAQWLDQHVGQRLSVAVWRGSEAVTTELTVQDLHALQPRRFIEFGGGVVHDISYQQARAMFVPQRGVVVTDSGYLMGRAGMATSVLITEINGTPIHTLDDFAAQLVKAGPHDQWLTRFIAPGREYTSELARVEVSDDWFASRWCERQANELADRWACRPLSLSGPVKPIEPLRAVQPITYREPLLQALAPSLVWVEFGVPHPMDNVYARHFRGAGLLVDPQQGLIAVDRNTVPIALGDVQVVLFGTESVAGSVVFLHPTHNVALIKVDPAQLRGFTFPSVALSQSPEVGRSVSHIIAFSSEGSLFSQRVGNYTETTLNFNAPRLPHFQTLPVDVYAAPNMPPSAGGVLVSDTGEIQALWSSFAFEDRGELSEGFWGLPADIIAEALQAYRQGAQIYDPGVVASYIPLSEARKLGLSEAWQARLIEVSELKRQALYVQQVYTDLANERFRVGDVLLAIDDQAVTSLRQMQKRLQQRSAQVTVLRGGEVVTLAVENTLLSATGTSRLVYWAGAYIQVPHAETMRRLSRSVEGVYVAHVSRGSPAQRDGLYPNRFITAIDGQPVRSLEDLLAAVSLRKPGDIVRVTLTLFNGQQRVIGLEIEKQFWPTFEFRRSVSGWTRQRYD